MPDLPHEPVLYKEIIHALQPRPSGRYVDGTVGAGGHARGILEACAPDGRLLGLDIDPQALALARETLAPYGPRVTLTQASFASLLDAMRGIGWSTVDGIVLDLGVSSMQLDMRERGFSFQHEAPLDMRFDPAAALTAADLVNETPESELAEILFRYGEEPRARRIASLLVAARPISTTTQLAAIVLRAYHQHMRRHPATRTFQALRIAVNDELGTLERALPRALEALQVGGRLAVIAFHSLEDRIVKTFIRERSSSRPRSQDNPTGRTSVAPTVREVNRKPIRPNETENRLNPRARSARLRIIEKLQVDEQG
jgi:16S rRNA (cytosine1402-N4)-methyltransferase